MFCINRDPLGSCCFLSSMPKARMRPSFLHLMTGTPRSDSAEQLSRTFPPRIVTASEGSDTKRRDVNGLIWKPGIREQKGNEFAHSEKFQYGFLQHFLVKLIFQKKPLFFPLRIDEFKIMNTVWNKRMILMWAPINEVTGPENITNKIIIHNLWIKCDHIHHYLKIYTDKTSIFLIKTDTFKSYQSVVWQLRFVRLINSIICISALLGILNLPILFYKIKISGADKVT